MTDAWPLALVGALVLVIGMGWRARRQHPPAPGDPSARRARMRTGLSDDPIMTSMGLGRPEPPIEDSAASRRP
jgi:hypothetical protein